jgi:hypothetical protein
MTVLLILGAACSLYLLWLQFRLASLSLPFLSATAAGMALFSNDYGLPASLAVGLMCGIALWTIGRGLIASARSPIVQLLTAAAFLLPAGIAGYGAAHGLAGLIFGDSLALTATAILGALATASMAWRSLAGKAERS